MTPSESLDLLISFAAHPQVDVLATDGSTPDRLVVGQLDTEHGYRPWNVERADGRGFLSGVQGNIPEIAREFAESGEEDEAERLMTLARGAAKHGSDALVTMSDLLLNGFPRNLVEEANPMTPEEAVALLGLFLRARDDFVFSIEPNYSQAMDRGAFYMILMRDLVASSWRWFSACAVSSHHTQNDRLMMLAQSALERVEYALRARDRLHERLQVPQTRDTGTDAIFYFNVVLLMLGGSLDAIALVAHRTHGISLDEHVVGWTRPQWMEALRLANPALAQLMDQRDAHRDSRDLVAVLRNTIHSDALRAITSHTAGARDERVLVPDNVANRLEEIANRLGSSADFGLSRERDELYVDPGVFVDATLLRIAGTMNALMDATPVETLQGVDPTGLLRAPPDDAFFGPWMSSRVRMLSGLA